MKFVDQSMQHLKVSNMTNIERQTCGHAKGSMPYNRFRSWRQYDFNNCLNKLNKSNRQSNDRQNNHKTIQGDTYIVVLIVLCYGVDWFAVRTLCAFSYFQLSLGN